MSITGKQYKQLVEALTDAFPSEESLGEMLRFELDKALNSIASGGNLQNMAFQLIGAAKAEGWLKDLILAARQANSGNPKLLKIAQELGLNSQLLEAEKVSQSKESDKPPPNLGLASEQLPTERIRDKTSKKYAFISYCRDNFKEVEKLHQDLSAKGEPLWWDQDILPGKNWETTIAEAMSNSYAVLACLSKETESRDSSGIYPELRDAIGIYRKLPPNSIFIIPIRLSECQIPNFKLDATENLNKLQSVDLFKDWDKGIERIKQALEATTNHPMSPL